MIVFSLPGIRVYDGERLFSVSYPLWAVLIGRGAAVIATRFSGSAKATVGILAFTLLQGFGVVATHPCQLAYYNALVGGVAGADRLGFERSYWADALTDSFQRQIVAAVPAGATIDVAPVLHPFYLQYLLEQSPILKTASLRLAAYDDSRSGGSRYVLMFHRKADPWKSLLPPPEGTKTLAEFRVRGVPLATLYELPDR
jgi:hypothetical protein